MAVSVVAGVRGVGVSAVCAEARGALPDDYELINFGDVMLEQAAVRGMAVEREELGQLSTREITRLQRRAGEYVADRAEACDVILSTHMAVETADGVLPGLSATVTDDLTPDQFVLVEASPEAIAERRDDDLPARQLDFQLDLQRAATMAYAIQTHSPVALIENTGSVADAAAELVATLEA